MRKIVCAVVAMVVFVQGFLLVGNVNALGDINMSVSPMRESVILNPGDTYKGSFMVGNPGYSEQDLYYHIEIKPFYVDEDYNPVFEVNEGDDRQMIKDWIKVVEGQSGVIVPNETVVVEYEIDVPENAPAGGQYACLSATTDVEPSTTGGINIGEGMAINHVILAEVTGNTVASGEILDAGVGGFLLNGKITAYSMIKNTGNVHGLATYTMKVSPLFSNEVIYSNEEDVEDHYVLPDRTFYNESYWEETPTMGVFNVSYVVGFQGKTSEISRVVIVCPWWILFIIILGIAILVIRLASLSKIKKMSKELEKKNKENA